MDAAWARCPRQSTYTARLGYLVGFGVTRSQCSFFTGWAPIDAHAAELAPYRTWKGTINFRINEPLPADLVTRLVVHRVAEFRTRARAGRTMPAS
jgi:uncharacterized protein YdhG (YjbR/CyaY superfamily)